MKLYFAAAAIALFAAAPSYAQSVMTAGPSVQEDCFRAAQSAHALSQLSRAGTLVNRGTLQAAAHNDDAAVADFNAALTRDPNLAPAYMSRGAVMLRTGRYQEARADFTRAIDLQGSDLHVAYFNRGEAQEASGNLVAAYHDYRKAQELAPNFQ